MYLLLIGSAVLIWVLSILITPISARVAQLSGGLDQPGERKLHQFTTPRMGGIGIGVLFFGSLSILSVLNILHLTTIMKGFTYTLFAILILGLWDDLKPVPAILKLIVELLLASILFATGLKSSSLIGPLPIVVDYLITIGWFIIISNAMNLIDGLDGLATSTALLIVLFMGFSTLLILPSSQSISILLPGSVFLLTLAGFYFWNRPPAVIFLGDSGSLFIGWFLAGYSLITGQILTPFLSDPTPLIPFLLLLFGYPLSDTLLSISRRFFNCNSTSLLVLVKSILSPDKLHLHHRFYQKYASAHAALQRLQLLHLFYCILALATVQFAMISSSVWLRHLPFTAGLFLLSSLLFWQHSTTSSAHIPPQHSNIPPTP